MTPERFALMQQLLNSAKFDWTYGNTEYLREPVDFVPRYPKNSVVVDLPRIRKIAFTLHKERSLSPCIRTVSQCSTALATR
jgi:hypothetical protein